MSTTASGVPGAYAADSLAAAPANVGTAVRGQRPSLLSVSLQGTWVGTVSLVGRPFGGAAYVPVDDGNGTAIAFTGNANRDVAINGGMEYRLEFNRTSGTAVSTLQIG